MHVCSPRHGMEAVFVRLATFVALVGLGIATGALVMLLNQSGLVSGDPDLAMVGVWTTTFLVGIFVFGWGLGKRTRL